MKKLAIKTKLSILWVVITLNMIYADVLSLYLPGIHEELASFAGNTPIKVLMLMGAIMVEIPIMMVFFSRILKYRVNRWINIIVGMLMIAFVVGPEIGNENINPHYVFIGSVEVILIIVIMVTAWKWKKESPSRPDRV